MLFTLKGNITRQTNLNVCSQPREVPLFIAHKWEMDCIYIALLQSLRPPQSTFTYTVQVIHSYRGRGATSSGRLTFIHTVGHAILGFSTLPKDTLTCWLHGLGIISLTFQLVENPLSYSEHKPKCSDKTTYWLEELGEMPVVTYQHGKVENALRWNKYCHLCT